MLSQRSSRNSRSLIGKAQLDVFFSLLTLDDAQRISIGDDIFFSKKNNTHTHASQQEGSISLIKKEHTNIRHRTDEWELD